MSLRTILIFIQVALLYACKIRKNMNFTQLAACSGYWVQEYQFFTEDYYGLSLYRMQNLSTGSLQKPVVLLWPGLLESPDSWIINNEQSLGYLLANSNFDVWVGSSRGTKYSIRHKTLSIFSQDYWQFSWQEMAI